MFIQYVIPKVLRLLNQSNTRTVPAIFGLAIFQELWVRICPQVNDRSIKGLVITKLAESAMPSNS
jgi:hypothetical protein